MKLVTRNHLEDWAKTVPSKAGLPYLISRLVRAITPASTQIDFPSGSAAYIGGWDGVVFCKEDTAYVPEGTSLWEFGTEKDNKGKADDDYEKRTQDSLGHNPKDCVFIFATPRFWKQKEKWIKGRKAENIWKDIKVYDSSILEQWLDIAISVSRWFSSQIGNYPLDGIITIEEFWKEWSTGPNGLALQPKVVTAGRQFEQEQLLNILQGNANIKAIKASTKNEAIAFIIATAKQFEENESERFFSKSLIVDTVANFRGIRINTNSPLNLIAKFDETQPLYAAVSEGHHVLIPLGADDSFNQDIITLPTIDRNGQINSLIESGLSEEDAVQFSRESGRNVTILKKLIGFPHRTKWVETENIREIIPALVLGRWDESYIGDIELLEKLFGHKHEDYLVVLKRWLSIEESPIIQIGETWRLTSPLDLWTILSSHLTQKDIQNIKDCFLIVYKNGNPIIKPKDENDFVAIFNQKRKYSSWSREGLAQSLILVANFGKVLIIPTLNNPQLWVDEIIFDLLNEASGELWVSIHHELPLIAEASPKSFIKAASSSLLKEQPEIMEVFKYDNQSGLLWALEGLAWSPEYLRDVGLILLKLSRLDPGGKIMNRPFNSLTKIFNPWQYQTFTKYEECIDILKYITVKEPEIGWTFLLSILPKPTFIIHPTQKMRWRFTDINANLPNPIHILPGSHSYIVTLLLNLFDYNENKFADLMSKTLNLSPKDRLKVLDWAKNVSLKIKQNKDYTTWHLIRENLYKIRTFPNRDSISSEELSKYEDIYEQLKPVNLVDQNIWLFNERWPLFAEGRVHKENGKQEKIIEVARAEALKKIIDEIGLKRTLDIRNSINLPDVLGDHLGRMITNENDIVTICECLNDSNNDQVINFIYAFIFRKSSNNDFEWVTILFKKLQEKGFNTKALANMLIPINQSKELWDFVKTIVSEIKIEYWQNVSPNFYSLSLDEQTYGIEKLMEYKRYFSALNVCYNFHKDLPTSLLYKSLCKAAEEESIEPTYFIEYKITSIFKEIDNRSDLDHDKRIKLEWLYLPILTSYWSERKPEILHNELSKNPQFFVDILKLLYKPKDQTKMENEIKDISNETIVNRSKQAYNLLNSWKKIPGMQIDNSINKTELENWVNKVREIAKEEERLEFADKHIGQVLAQYPENIPAWPQEIIFSIIEDINTNSLNDKYYVEMINKRGFLSIIDGNLKREKSSYFKDLKNNYKNRFPIVAKIFNDISTHYSTEAKEMDEITERDNLEY